MHSAAGYRRWFNPKHAQLGQIWVRSCSYHKRTLTEFICNRTETTSSTRSWSRCFGLHPNAIAVFTPNELHQGCKRTRVQFNQTKQGRFESTLKHNWIRPSKTRSKNLDRERQTLKTSYTLKFPLCPSQDNNKKKKKEEEVWLLVVKCNFSCVVRAGEAGLHQEVT